MDIQTDRELGINHLTGLGNQLHDSLKNELEVLAAIVDATKNRLAANYTVDLVDELAMHRRVWLEANVRVKVDKYFVCLSRTEYGGIDVRLICYQPQKKGNSILDYWGKNAAEGWLQCRELITLDQILMEVIDMMEGKALSQVTEQTPRYKQKLGEICH